MASAAVRMVRGYESSIQRNPLATKSATCVIGFALGDLAAQKFKHAKNKREYAALLAASHPAPLNEFDVMYPPPSTSVDYQRMLSMALFGGLVAAPQMHVFFTWLDRAIMPNNPKSPVAVVGKVVIDQAVNSPVGSMLFFTWTRMLQGKPEKALNDIKTKLWPTTRTSWQLWPAAQAVNFYLVPPNFRIVFINAIAIVWTTILSTISNA